jgi:anti-sigma regulatory factor (Ser/Thr protein kinase)
VAVSGPVDAPTVTRVVAVDEPSQVGEVRRTALQLADRAGLDDAARGRAGLVATELATNLARHATEGMVLLRTLDEEGGGIELLSLDRGPGMDLARCLADGYSTGGSAGEGLGAVRRIADVFDGWSSVGAGTALLARLGATRGGERSPDPVQAMPVGAVCTPAPGEQRSGDAWTVDRRPGRLRLLLVDGLGHGAPAADAAATAVRVFHAHPEPGPAETLERLHEALRGTRGAAAAVAEIVPGTATVRFAGVGNVGATILTHEGTRSLMSRNGIVGHQVRKIQEVAYPWTAQAVLTMASDGLRAQRHLEEHPGLAARHPALVAGIFFRDHLRGRDAASVLVARGSPPSAFPE